MPLPSSDRRREKNNNMSHSTDAELLDIYKNAHQQDYAFNLIVRKYQEKIYWHVRRMVLDHDDANDLVQDIFIKAWKSLKEFRGDSGIYTWLYRIATNETLTFLRKKKRRFFLPWQDVENMMSEKLESDAYFNGSEIEKKLQKAILTLPDKQKVVFNLRYFDEMKYEEMSGILNTSVGSLKASFHHASKKIEEYFKEH